MTNKEKNIEELKAMTIILKKKLMMMIIKEWNGKDFTKLDDVEKMTDDIINVLSEVGNSERSSDD
jgi:hypothetical protein